MVQTFTARKRVRKFFGHIREIAEMPNLIEVQKASYDQFLLVKEPEGGRPDGRCCWSRRGGNSLPASYRTASGGA